MARPTKLDDVTAQRIIESVRHAMPLYLAAQAAGIHPDTLREWKVKARKGLEPYAAFVVRLKRAEGEGLEEMLKVVRLAATKGTWQAAAWLAERRYPRSFALRTSRFGTPTPAPLTEDQAKAKWRELTGQDWPTSSDTTTAPKETA